MKPFSPLTFGRVKSGIRFALVKLKTMRSNLERKDFEEEDASSQLIAQKALQIQWNEWMKARYHKRWEKFAAQDNLVEVVEFIRMYLNDIEIARLEEIKISPSKAENLSQQAIGIADASDELLFLLDLCKKEKLEISAADVHKA